ncbi:ricin-type beta-trefoil lectin domain protein [Lentzea sp. JNUCC 0626]|uniref:ricin-type beta-trefoil lectin domain protein n=1 Tax=Lentzea sp. JNUCC 0626 TaxID=3367513 RepID=UPI003748DCAC
MRTRQRVAALATGVALGLSVVVTVPAVATTDVPHAITEPRPGEATPKDRDGKVLLYVDGRDQKSVRDAVAKHGGKVTSAQGTRAQVAVPADQVAALGEEQSIVEMKRPERAVPMAITSEGVQASGAAGWIADGKKGQGVKVGVIDVGFARLDEAQQEGELPTGIAVDNSGCHDVTRSDDHGTAIAEVVHDMAPDAQLFLACVDGPLDFQAAAEWLRQQGVQVITAAIGFLSSGRGDGSGEPGSPADVVRKSREAGITWSVAAGNLARTHFAGKAVDANGNGYVEFDGTAQNNGFNLAAGATATVALKWDAWPKTNEDLDLYVMKQPKVPSDPADTAIKAASTTNQRDVAGGARPTEEVTFTNDTGAAQFYYLYVRNHNAKFTTRMDLFVSGPSDPLQYNTPAGSVTEPATSPYVMAVGATVPGSGTLEGYSGQGPTIDGRTKPDITGFAKVSTSTYGPQQLTGTSTAAAHVAGAAALLRSANPQLDPAQIQSALQTRTNPRKSDNQWGTGVLALGTPDTVPVVKGNGYTPFPKIATIHGKAFTAGEVFTLPIPDIPGDTTAVALNVSVRTNPASGAADVPSGLDVFPENPAQSTSKATTVRVQPGDGWVNAMVIAKVGQDRAIRLRAGAGPVFDNVDLLGYFSGNSASSYFPQHSPVRVLDTRGLNGSPRSTPLGAGEVITVKARGANGVPDNATAVAVSLTSVESTQGTAMGVFGTENGGTALSVNRNERRSNASIVAIAEDGNIRIRNASGRSHVLLDVAGWFAPGDGAKYVPLDEPSRIADNAALGQGETTRLQVTGLAGVPANATGAVLMPSVAENVLGTELSVSPAEIGWSPVTNIATRQRQRLSTTVLAPLGESGKVAVRNERGNAQVALDAQGYFLGGSRFTDDGACALPTGEAGYTSMFDGRAETNLSAWRVAGSTSVAANGCELTTTEGTDISWYAAHSFGNDYTVKFDWKGNSTGVNSGLFVMFPDPGSNPAVPRDNGVEVDLSTDDTMGSILPGKPITRPAPAAGQWHAVEVTVAWNTVIVKLDGQEINRHTVTAAGRAFANSFIGVQNDGAYRTSYLRNLRVKNNTAVRNGEIKGINSRCLDVVGNDPAAGQVQVWDCNSFPNQRWTTNVDLQITNVGKCLGAQNQGTAAGTPVVLVTCNPEYHQQWVVRPDGAIINVRSGRCLTPTTSDRGAALQLQDCTSRSDQVWALPDQHGQIGAFVNGASGRCLDIANNDSRSNKAQSWDCYGNSAQQWAVTGDGRITSSGKCLDVFNSGTAAGTAVNIFDCNGGANQQWQARADGTVVNPVSGRCLTAAGLVNGSGQSIQDCTGAPNQVWRMSAQSLWTGAIVGNGGKCADVKGENPANGVVWLWQCFSPPGEVWTATGDGTARSMGACLDVSALTNGTPTVIANCHNGNSQQWAVRPNATFVHVEASRCMDVQSASVENGAKMQLWDCVGTPQQRWAVPLRAS